MKISLILIGKTSFPFVKQGMEEYHKRIIRYAPFQCITIDALKNASALSQAQIKQKEGELILAKLKSSDYLVLLDERGKQPSSLELSRQLETWMQQGRDLVFVIGGAYGFSDEVYARAGQQLSLSRLTYSHQLVRVLFLEQLYRAFSILRGEPYHHE